MTDLRGRQALQAVAACPQENEPWRCCSTNEGRTDLKLAISQTTATPGRQNLRSPPLRRGAGHRKYASASGYFGAKWQRSATGVACHGFLSARFRTS